MAQIYIRPAFLLCDFSILESTYLGSQESAKEGGRDCLVWIYYNIDPSLNTGNIL